MELCHRHSRRLGRRALSIHPALQVRHGTQQGRGIRRSIRAARPYWTEQVRHLLDAPYGQMVAALHGRDARRGASHPQERWHTPSALMKIIDFSCTLRNSPMLIINNDDVARVLTMGDTIEVLERAYTDLITRDAVCRPRIDIQIPTAEPGVIYQWGT